MGYLRVDNEELLRLSLQAINSGQQLNAMEMLKTLLERDSEHAYAKYLLAAQHAQLGMFDRAEAEFRAVVAQMPELLIARLQLAQLLLSQGKKEEARTELALLVSAQPGQALGPYARALLAASDEDLATAAIELRAGLAFPQHIPALAVDMERLLATLETSSQSDSGNDATGRVSSATVASLFLTGYGRTN